YPPGRPAGAAQREPCLVCGEVAGGPSLGPPSRSPSRLRVVLAGGGGIAADGDEDAGPQPDRPDHEYLYARAAGDRARGRRRCREGDFRVTGTAQASLWLHSWLHSLPLVSNVYSENLILLGAGERVRTAGLPFTRRLLCLLSYTGADWLHRSRPGPT